MYDYDYMDLKNRSVDYLIEIYKFWLNKNENGN